jgi:protocatechuate 3,4-dioxygenase beta subunit
MNENPEWNRRHVLLLGGVLAAGGFGGLRGIAAALSRSGGNPCDRATWSAKLAGPNEPGEPLHVTGRVLAPDGVTPAAGVTFYAYHTDARGHYSRWPGSTPRLRGWMKTGPDGRYEYKTIRPGAYPGRTNAAHIHTQFWGAGVPPQYGTDLLFQGDPLLTEEERRRSDALGRFAFIRPAERDGNGMWHATHDIRLKSLGDRFEDNTMHGLEPCGVKP